MSTFKLLTFDPFSKIDEPARFSPLLPLLNFGHCYAKSLHTRRLQLKLLSPPRTRSRAGACAERRLRVSFRPLEDTNPLCALLRQMNKRGDCFACLSLPPSSFLVLVLLLLLLPWGSDPLFFNVESTIFLPSFFGRTEDRRVGSVLCGGDLVRRSVRCLKCDNYDGDAKRFFSAIAVREINFFGL